MSVSKDMKQQAVGDSAMKRGVPVAAAARSFRTKAPGTRAGTIEDWRVGGTKKSAERLGRAKRLRDGR
jgi:hypothetical protein